MDACTVYSCGSATKYLLLEHRVHKFISFKILFFIVLILLHTTYLQLPDLLNCFAISWYAIKKIFVTLNSKNNKQVCTLKVQLKLRIQLWFCCLKLSKVQDKSTIYIKRQSITRYYLIYVNTWIFQWHLQPWSNYWSSKKIKYFTEDEYFNQEKISGNIFNCLNKRNQVTLNSNRIILKSNKKVALFSRFHLSVNFKTRNSFIKIVDMKASKEMETNGQASKWAGGDRLLKFIS